MATGVDGAWVIQPLSTWETTGVYFSWLQHPLKKFEFVFFAVFFFGWGGGGRNFPGILGLPEVNEVNITNMEPER